MYTLKHVFGFGSKLFHFYLLLKPSLCSVIELVSWKSEKVHLLNNVVWFLL